MGETLGQQIVIENKPGGDTIIGMGALGQSPADGYTIGFISDTQAIHIATNRSTPYDFQKDFIPVLQMARIPFTFVVNAEDAGTRSLAEFIQYARDNPGWLTFGSVGPGSPHETAFLWLQHLGGFKSAIVPYRGIAPAMQDLLAGQVKTLFWGGVANDQWVKEKKIRRMAVTTREKLSLAPEAETISSLYPEYEMVSWYGLAVPRGTPQPIVDRLNAEVNKALQSDEIRTTITSYGFLPAGGTSAEIQGIINSDIEKYRKILPTFAAGK
jgi:tripartite-type tricarboxylate transporter receptor subunit TctC